MLTVNLTTTHSDPEPEDLPTVTIAQGGNYVRIKLPSHPGRKVLPPKRGPITKFSRSSRARMMDRIATIDREAVHEMPLMITLTYPKEWPEDMAVCKAQLQAFCKRLMRRYNNASIIWKLEYQKRGAPHFHLLLWGVPFLPLRQVARDWFEVVGSGLAAHESAGTRVERIRSWKGVASYVSKYLAKVVESNGRDTPGRFWGVIGAANLPTRLLVCIIPWRAVYIMRRFVWRLLAARGCPPKHRAGWCGTRLYCDDRIAAQLLNAALTCCSPSSAR